MSIKLYPKKWFQIKIFINLEIIGEKDKKKIISIFKKIYKKLCLSIYIYIYIYKRTTTTTTNWQTEEIKNWGIKKKNNDEMDYMKNLDCNNQIKIFINLEIIGEEKLYIFF